MVFGFDPDTDKENGRFKVASINPALKGGAFGKHSGKRSVFLRSRQKRPGDKIHPQQRDHHAGPPLKPHARALVHLVFRQSSQ